METNLVEMFSSIQGEGLYIGVRQIFIRFSGCNLKCQYCDTPFIHGPRFRVEIPPGSGKYEFYDNPVNREDLAAIINKLNPGSCHSISLTGGEPLLHAAFIESIGPLFRDMGTKVYLETNGTLPEQLSMIIDSTDIISMDIKLPGSTGCGELWNVHEEFLRIGHGKDLFVKTVVTSETEDAEVVQTCETIKKVDRKIPLIIQPVEPHPGFPGRKPSIDRIMSLQELGIKYLDDVRIIPQTHKYMGLL